MRAYLHQLFHVADQEKIDEKTMLARIAVSVCVVLFCLTANVVSAYAYFSHTITSGNNTIQAARYELVVNHVKIEQVAAVSAGEAEISSQEESAETGLLLQGQPMTEPEVKPVVGGYELINPTDKARYFYFTIAKPDTENMASVGYCRIEVVTNYDSSTDEDETCDVQKFYTLPIGTYLKDGKQEVDNSRTIKIQVPAWHSAQVAFEAEWGSCSKTPIVGDGIVMANFGEGEPLKPAILIDESTEAEIPEEDSTMDDKSMEGDDTQDGADTPDGDDALDGANTPDDDTTLGKDPEQLDTPDAEDKPEQPDTPDAENESKQPETTAAENESKQPETTDAEDKPEQPENPDIENEPKQPETTAAENESEQPEDPDAGLAPASEDQEEPGASMNTDSAEAGSGTVVPESNNEVQDESEGE